MNYPKAAAVVAGSMMAVGMAAPAFADTMSSEAMTSMPTSINGGVNQALAEQPLQKAADSAQVDSTLTTVSRAAGHLRGGTSAGTLLGQAGTAAQGLATSRAARAVPGAPLLGGLPLGSATGALGGLPG